MLPRKITSLREDMQKLGLTGLIHEDINGKTPPARKPVTESKASPKSAKQIAEAKKTIAAQRARAAKIRESRMAKKLAMYETRLQRIERAAKKANYKVEFKIRQVKGVQKRAAVMESYDVRKALGNKPLTAAALAESFGKVAALAGTLGRVFGVAEHFLQQTEADLGIPVMHPDSEYGLDVDHSNAGGKSGSGDVTDHGSEKEDDETEPQDNLGTDDDMNEDDEKSDDLDAMGEDDDQKDDDEVQTEDDEAGCDDDMQTEEDDDKQDDVSEDEENDDDDVQTEDDEQDADAEKTERRKSRKEAREQPIDFELHTIRLEAEEMAAKAVGSDPTLNTGYLATDLLNDMVSYLGGAMKLYGKLQQAMTSFKYLGQDKNLDQAGGTVDHGEHNDAYIGTVDKPEGETAVGQGVAQAGEDEEKVESTKKPAAKK